MVRVNHPPGGKMQLHSAPTPEPKTVRVLKPPGGGSSISFNEEDSHGKGAKAEATSKQAADRPSSTSSPSSAPPTVEQTPTEAPKEAPSFPTPVGEPASTPSNGEAKPCETAQTNGHQTAEPLTIPAKETNGTVSDTPAANGSAVPADPPQKSTPPSKSDSTVQEVSDGVKDLSVSKPSLHLTINTPSKATDSVDTVACNSKTSSASTTSPSSPAISSPTIPSPSVVSPSIKNPDTGGRLFGETPTTPTSELSARKVKDHMRSSIFGHDDRLPTTSSSSHNSGADSNSTAAQQGPPQRQRIPPGGFSTKLW